MLDGRSIDIDDDYTPTFFTFSLLKLIFFLTNCLNCLYYCVDNVELMIDDDAL